MGGGEDDTLTGILARRMCVPGSRTCFDLLCHSSKGVLFLFYKVSMFWSQRSAFSMDITDLLYHPIAMLLSKRFFCQRFLVVSKVLMG